MKIDPFKKPFLVYVIFLHFIFFALLWKSNLLMALAYKAGYPRPEISSFHLGIFRYQKIQDASVPAGSTLFIGDSITHGLVTSSITNSSVNFGIGADTTVGVLSRVKQFQSISTAKAIILTIGVNDLVIGRDVHSTVDNIKKIINQFNQRQTFLSAVLPVDEGKKRWESLNEKIDSLNSELTLLAANLPNVTYMDSNPILRGADGNLKVEHHVGDGLHLSPSGYKVWAEFLRNTLALYQ